MQSENVCPKEAGISNFVYGFENWSAILWPWISLLFKMYKKETEKYVEVLCMKRCLILIKVRKLF